MIAGTSISADGTPHAVTWINFKIGDLNDNILNPNGWVISSATGINSRGDIVGSGHEAAAPQSSYGILLTSFFILIPPGPFPGLSNIRYIISITHGGAGNCGGTGCMAIRKIRHR